MRVVGLDIHRVFAEAVMLDDGKVVRLGRVGMTREHLDAFDHPGQYQAHVAASRCHPWRPHSHSKRQGLLLRRL